ncbi:hypothetical protein F511_29589 [Dorcoceras hygrometricum]|uniref:Uncharacterized protein n=1 Tax=Dorcoceras hygrometricum TaxID=472368 RepID=A0A2Z7D8U6_9LAMI|nr:hypothetical protein F511_29589 [Dorcoceras hygrometricum]
MTKRGKILAAAALNHRLAIKADPAGEVVVVEIEQMNRAVLLEVVAEVEVREEAIGVDLPREDLTAVVVDHSEDHLKIG